MMTWRNKVHVRSLATGLAIVLLAAGCSSGAGTDTTTASPLSVDTESQFPTTTLQPDAGGTTVPGNGGGTSEPPGDVGHPCSFIDAAEMSTILHNEVEIDDSFETDCFYEPVGGYEAGLGVHSSVWMVPSTACPTLIQTEPIFPDQTVEPAPAYGEAAAIITSEGSLEIQTCTDVAAVFVIVSGTEGTSGVDRLATAKTIIDEILASL